MTDAARDALRDALIAGLELKAVPRSGWVRVGVAAPESVAAHSWGIGWLVLALRPLAPHLDLGRALTYAVLHDLAEVRTGDWTPHDGVAPADKQRAEREAMHALCATIPGRDALLDAWEAYEAQQDAESRWVRQLDRLDMALQAAAYARDPDGPGAAALAEFGASAAAVVTDPALVGLLEAAREVLTSAGAGGPPTPDRDR